MMVDWIVNAAVAQNLFTSISNGSRWCNVLKVDTSYFLDMVVHLRCNVNADRDVC